MSLAASKKLLELDEVAWNYMPDHYGSNAVIKYNQSRNGEVVALLTVSLATHGRPCGVCQQQ